MGIGTPFREPFGAEEEEKIATCSDTSGIFSHISQRFGGMVIAGGKDHVGGVNRCNQMFLIWEPKWPFLA